MDITNYIHSANDLVTSYEETRAGFLRLALEKNRQATPYVEEAKALKTMALQANRPEDLLDILEIRPALITAAGLSDKAIGHLTLAVQEEAIKNLIEKFLKTAGKDFVDELVFRFLLTRGDSLGGRMRNLAGQLAQQQLLRSLIATLSVQGKGFFWLNFEARRWIQGRQNDPNIELQARGLNWKTGDKSRTLLLNLTIPGIGKGKNVDLCLFDGTSETYMRGRNAKSVHYDKSKYLALGELKGGIDPAGADEHWKTANSALQRIRELFLKDGYNPHLFFVGAAIEKAMAEEIFNQLKSGSLSFAANLTDEKQLTTLCNWLIKL